MIRQTLLAAGLVATASVAQAHDEAALKAAPPGGSDTIMP